MPPGDYLRHGLPREERRYEEIRDLQRLPPLFEVGAAQGVGGGERGHVDEWKSGEGG